MKIKHKVSGKVIELMDGTKFAKSAYDLVDGKEAEAPVKDTSVETVKKVAPKKKTAKTSTKKQVKPGKVVGTPDATVAPVKTGDAAADTTVK